MKKIARMLMSPWILGTPVILLFSIANAQAETECTPAKPCEMTLYATPGTDKAHITYGDTLTLSYDGSDVNLIENVAAWENDTIDLEPTVIWLRGLTELENRLVPGYEFEIEVNGETHEGLKLYRDPGSSEWLVKAPVTAHGEVHGGTAHMQQ